MGWLVSGAGGLLVFLVLRQLFATLWHPSARGRFDEWVPRTLWWVSGRGGGRARSTTIGPLSLLLVVLSWAGLTVIGWALVYWPHLPTSFSYGTGLQPGARTDLLDAVYLSFVTLTTLGFGDIVPTAGWLRIAVPVEALVGFAILTAAVSWGLQVQPALTRRRVLATRLDQLRRADAPEQLARLHPAARATLLLDLAAGVSQTTVDLTQYSVTYHFRDATAATSLAATVGVAQELARRGAGSEHPGLGVAADALAAALSDLARLLDDQFVHTGGSPAEVFSAYATAHGHEPSP